MKATTAAGCFVIAVAVWPAGPAVPASVPQAPLSGLPPADYSLGPDSQPQPDVPKGTLTRHTLAPGKFFPGTPHNYQIYVPAQYDPTRPIACMIFLDGSGYQWSFQIAADGSLVNGEPFQRLEMPEEGLFSGVGGLAVDSIGYMWATSAMGIQVCEQPGRCTNILNKPELNATPMTSIAFGGPNRAWPVRHTRWQAFSQGDQTHGSRGVGTRQAAATRAMRAAAPALFFSIVMTAAAQESAKTVADGVYTDAQAVRGAAVYDAACTGCHRADLGGATGPSLREQRFAREFAGKDLKALFTKIAATMPRNAPASLGDNVYLDIVAHVLKENGFPAGSQELTADALDGIRVLAGRPKPPLPIGDFSYVEVVGCLTASPENAWTLTRASEPVGASPTGSARPMSATTKPLGTQTFHLLDAMAYAPDGHEGHKIYIRGLLIKLPGEQRMTISSFEMVSPTCND